MKFSISKALEFTDEEIITALLAEGVDVASVMKRELTPEIVTQVNHLTQVRLHEPMIQ